MTRPRTRSREIALQALFCQDVRDKSAAETALGAVEMVIGNAEAAPDIKRFATELARGVLTRVDEIDVLISGAADNWDFQRIAAVDRNVLRLAVYELLDQPDIPAVVSIDEAIELGKRFSTAQSGAFVNGLLDRIRRDLGLPSGHEPSADGAADSAADGAADSETEPSAAPPETGAE
jgi:N utilization substance protein B